jgi:hypothetical protein
MPQAAVDHEYISLKNLSFLHSCIVLASGAGRFTKDNDTSPDRTSKDNDHQNGIIFLVAIRSCAC